MLFHQNLEIQRACNCISLLADLIFLFLLGFLHSIETFLFAEGIAKDLFALNLKKLQQGAIFDGSTHSQLFYNFKIFF
jgi:hypothetical protein